MKAPAMEQRKERPVNPTPIQKMTAKALRVVLRLSRAEASGPVRPSEERVGGLGRSRPMRERERVSLRREGIVVPFP
jgi:hypothetical protein